jgi:hypothetical protein
MPIHHVTYAMQNARNAQRKAIHMLQKKLSHETHKPPAPRGEVKRARHHRQKRAPTHPTQEIKHTPSSPRKRVKVA